MFSSAAAFFTRSAKALVYMSYKQACFFHNSIKLSSNSSLQNSISRQTRQNTSYMTSWPTNWVNWVTTFRTDRWQLFTLWTCRQLDVELSRVGVAIDTSPTQLNSTSSWVELCRYKRPCMLKWKKVHFLSQCVRIENRRYHFQKMQFFVSGSDHVANFSEILNVPTILRQSAFLITILGRAEMLLLTTRLMSRYSDVDEVDSLSSKLI